MTHEQDFGCTDSDLIMRFEKNCLNRMAIQLGTVEAPQVGEEVAVNGFGDSCMIP